MTSPNPVTNPERGVYYSLAVHGEPPEGVEVLWWHKGTSWSEVRFDLDTHWMLAPQPAPEPAEAEEPPFPLSREEWKNEWRAAGYPGAVKPEAPEGEAEEGPWSLKEAEDEIWLRYDTGGQSSSSLLWRRVEGGYGVHRRELRRLVSGANDAHRLRGELEKAQAEVERLRALEDCVRLADTRAERLEELGALLGCAWDNLPDAVRSLVARAEKAEEERDALRRQKQAVQAELDTMSARLANRGPRVRVFADIGHERLKQDKKWGDQSDKGDAVFCAILGEEFGEVCQAFLQEKPTHEIREELVQTAAVAVQWIEILDRRASHAGEGE